MDSLDEKQLAIGCVALFVLLLLLGFFCALLFVFWRVIWIGCRGYDWVRSFHEYDMSVGQ